MCVSDIAKKLDWSCNSRWLDTFSIMAIIRLLVISSVLSVACGNYNLDPARDPVRQRLEIPAHPVFVSDYVSGGQQHSRKKSRGIPNVVVEADHPFSLTLPQDSIPGHIITHRKVSHFDG